MNDLWIDKTSLKDPYVLQIICKGRPFIRFWNYLYQLRTICCKRNSKLTQILYTFISQSKASISEWRGDKLALIFRAGGSSVGVATLRLKKTLFSFQEQYAKHHLPRIDVSLFRLQIVLPSVCSTHVLQPKAIYFIFWLFLTLLSFYLFFLVILVLK